MAPETGHLLILGVVGLSLVANAASSLLLWRNRREDRSITECDPEFRLQPYQSPATQRELQTVWGISSDPGDQQEKWFVICFCGRHTECAWLQAAQQIPLSIGAAVDRDLLRLGTPYSECTDGLDRNRHPAGVYHLTPKARLLGPLGFVIAALESNPPSGSPVVRPGVDYTERGANHGDSKGYPANPVHASEHSLGRAR